MARPPRTTNRIRDQKQCLSESAAGEAALSNEPDIEKWHSSRSNDLSFGSLEMGQSYLDRLDKICASDGNAASSDDPRLELETFLCSNLSGVCLFRLLTADVCCSTITCQLCLFV